eukprot:Polyplicarium_translucidae@DN2841_c0_g1_i6.p1
MSASSAVVGRTAVAHAFHPDGTRAALAVKTGCVHILDLHDADDASTWRMSEVLDHGAIHDSSGFVVSVDWSATGMLVSGATDGTVVVWTPAVAMSALRSATDLGHEDDGGESSVIAASEMHIMTSQLAGVNHDEATDKGSKVAVAWCALRTLRARGVARWQADAVDLRSAHAPTRVQWDRTGRAFGLLLSDGSFAVGCKRPGDPDGSWLLHFQAVTQATCFAWAPPGQGCASAIVGAADGRVSLLRWGHSDASDAASGPTFGSYTETSIAAGDTTVLACSVNSDGARVAWTDLNCNVCVKGLAADELHLPPQRMEWPFLQFLCLCFSDATRIIAAGRDCVPVSFNFFQSQSRWECEDFLDRCPDWIAEQSQEPPSADSTPQARCPNAPAEKPPRVHQHPIVGIEAWKSRGPIGASPAVMFSSISLEGKLCVWRLEIDAEAS